MTEPRAVYATDTRLLSMLGTELSDILATQLQSILNDGAHGDVIIHVRGGCGVDGISVTRKYRRHKREYVPDNRQST